MKQNPNIKPIKVQVDALEKKFFVYQDMFDSLIKCQRDWMYLEPIFSSDEMIKELPTEKGYFNEVDIMWRKTMKTFQDEDAIFEIVEYPAIADSLVKCNSLLELIQRALNTYLETKRAQFPRFYFLSDEELLEILSRAKDPTLVTKYMNK